MTPRCCSGLWCLLPLHLPSTLGWVGRALPLPAAASGAPDVSFWRALGLVPGTKCTPAVPGPMEFHPSELKNVVFCPKQRWVAHGEVALPAVAAGRRLV